MGKTKVVISGPGIDMLQKSGKDPCAVCLSGAGANSIFSDGCSSWVHMRCSGIYGTLNPDPTFRCKRCTGLARPVDVRQMTRLSGKEEAWGGAILLLPWGLLILRWWLWTHFHNNMPCRMGKIQWLLACPSSPPAHFPSLPEEFTMHAFGVQCSIQAILPWAPTSSQWVSARKM